jgi:hypothetical protein
VLADDGGEVTDSGARVLSEFGVALTPPSKSRRIFCKPCLDWSERRFHIGGHVGAEICRRCLELGWVKRKRDTRTLALTATGEAGLRDLFGVDFSRVERKVSTPQRSAQFARELLKV